MQTKKTIEFFTECEPPTSTAQQRQFFAKGKSALTPKSKLAAATWQAIVEQHAPAKPIEGPIAVSITLTWQGEGMPKPRTKKPDLDNSVKLLLDAMTKAGYWKDDAKISFLTLAKFDGELPGVYICVEQK